jgi:transcriptional regulator with XRE-family HTH domain
MTGNKRGRPAQPSGTFGKRLFAARKRRHWTQQQAAHHIGVDPATYARWERGDSTPTQAAQRGAAEMLG